MIEPSLADSFREAGIQVGDIVEMAHFPDALAHRLSDCLGEKLNDMEGELVEVSGIGETKILGFCLVGFPKISDQTSRTYGSYDWKRDFVEMSRQGKHVFRCVGIKRKQGYIFHCPELENIYHRCSPLPESEL